ncbi:MAG: SCO family protein [Bacteroidota bacterium]
MKKNYFLPLALIVVCLILIGFFIYNRNRAVPIRHLPYYGKKKVNGNDSSYHIVPDFTFSNQNGKIISKKDIAGNIYVTDYFFTTCQSICPKMKKQMKRIYEYFKSDNDVIFVSHTVDPENDTVETLKKFSKQMNVNDEKWIFLTGSKEKLYDLARNGYFLDATSGNGGAEDFIHTQNFALIDKSFHIRGYYDGTDSSEVDRLIKEIELLKQEYEEKR